LTSPSNPERQKAYAARLRQRAIGRELRRHYDDVIKETPPADMLEILSKCGGAVSWAERVENWHD
jgi:hypothetical protein